LNLPCRLVSKARPCNVILPDSSVTGMEPFLMSISSKDERGKRGFEVGSIWLSLLFRMITFAGAGLERACQDINSFGQERSVRFIFNLTK